MKARVILIPIVVLVAAVAIYSIFSIKGSPVSDRLTMDSLAGLSESEQDEILEEAFSGGFLPNGEEVEILVWAFANRGEQAQAMLQKYSREFSNLPRHLSDAALQLFKEMNPDAGLAALSLARELYPNDPDVLGVTGVIAFLGGRELDARQFLEEAESWRQHRPLVDFYLGGILILSESTADRTRGKNLLMRVVNGDDPEFRELAGLSLLGNSGIPMIRQDVESVFGQLSEDSVFRAGNSNLSAEVIRILLNRIVPFLPTEALELADLLMEYPGRTAQDQLGIIQLAQSLGNTQKAEDYLLRLEKEDTFAEGSPEFLRLERVKAIQLIMEQQFEQALKAIQTIVKTQDDSPELQNMFKTAMAYEVPLEIERELLRTYLEIPVSNVRTSLNVTSRLMAIDPLGEDQWISYATKNLLHLDPIRVGQWLTSIGASEKIIDYLGSKEEKTSNEYLLLVNSYLEVENPDDAQAALALSENTIDPAIVAYFRARIYDQQDKKEEAFSYWKDAYQYAVRGNTFPLLKNLGILAGRLDQPVSALQALYTAFSSGVPFSSDEAAELLNLTLEYGNLSQSIEIASYLAEENPEENDYANNLAYFNFLAERNLEDSIEKMRVIVEDSPDVPEYRLTLALGLLKAGRINEADRLVQSTDVDWNKMGTRGKMVYAVVLTATDKRTLAEGLIQNMNLEDLIPEEKALLEAF
ncbi:hypothetical protein G0Q06_07760 [Puniceicoccales bacterium CK1056]|uniref:Tetratricopeptide repeat protein n=1 Tax=Oceanipulchritudo coccoides TaxID=2706888 RepID=A0A6B2M3U8_9BACT|nr:hypothetical protein [Oceanipulchritudo coccoides]NDV62340.1 hypothetical protein [Oceanipulchritudo coccoides]